MNPAILITGSNGHVGSALARRLLATTDLPLILWVHAGNRDTLLKMETFLRGLLGPAADKRVTFAGGDLEADEPFAGVPPHRIGFVVHCAATTRFSVDWPTARQVTVEGTRRTLRFAEHCPSLQRVALVSSLFASGLQDGDIAETAFPGDQGFSNAYERSKWAAEQVLFDEFAHLPYRVFRPPTIIADDRQGTVTRRNVFHNTVLLFLSGLLHDMPGDPTSPMYFVAMDFVVEVICSLLFQDDGAPIYHVWPTEETAVTLEQVVSIVVHSINEIRIPAGGRAVIPNFLDLHSFEALAKRADNGSGAIVGQALASLLPVARQLFVHKRVDSRNLSRFYTGGLPGPQETLIRNTCVGLVRNGTLQGDRHDH